MSTRVRWLGLELPNRVIADPKFRSEKFGRFTVEPFERGFGTTVGNSPPIPDADAPRDRWSRPVGDRRR
jgi:hypothetical protein